jgi:serine/threonine protein phosphatase PrpC
MAKNDNSVRRAMVSAPLEFEAFEPQSSVAMLEIGAGSVKGRLRAYNSDHYLAVKITRGLETLVTSLAEANRPPSFEEHGYALLVADGIGSNGESAQASRAALSALAHLAIQYGKWNVRVDDDTAAVITEQIRLFYRLTDHALRRVSHRFPGTGLKTSLTMVAVAGADAFFASVGNSKAFLFREGDLISLATNRTEVEQERPGGNSHQHVDSLFTKVVGGDSSGTDVDIEHIKLSPSDRLMLSTNGLTDVVTEAEIADGLALRRRPDEDCEQLLDLAVLAGSSDDVTVMVADYRETQRR